MSHFRPDDGAIETVHIELVGTRVRVPIPKRARVSMQVDSLSDAGGATIIGTLIEEFHFTQRLYGTDAVVAGCGIGLATYTDIIGFDYVDIGRNDVTEGDCVVNLKVTSL